MMLFTGNANHVLAEDVAHRLGVPLGKALVGTFSDGEVQIEIEEKFGITWGLPILHYNELLGLAQGMSPDELALDLHAVSVEPFLKKIL